MDENRRLQGYPWVKHEIKVTVDRYKPNIVFAQLQTANVIDIDTARYLGKYGKACQWQGDIREGEIMTWFKTVGKNLHSTMFTNMSDVEELRREGVRSDYLQIGFNPREYYYDQNRTKVPDILFLGNYYPSFPLSAYRQDTICKLKSRYKDRFGVFGQGWNNCGISTSPLHPNQERLYYSNCKIAINLSQVSRPRYTSDRLFRLMGSGAFCLNYKYPLEELEFTSGVHLVDWHHHDELFDKIDYFLTNDGEREKIRRAGYEWVHRTCTWKSRIMDFLVILES